MTPSTDLSLTQSALDFEGLGKLRAQARQDATQAVKETAQQFEAMFIQMMMKSMRETVEKDELSGSQGQETFEGMFDQEVAHQMAKRGAFGLGDMLVKDHERRSQMVSTADALLARDNAPAAPKPLHAPAAAFPLGGAAQHGLPLPAARALKALQMPTMVPAPGDKR
jgi:Rod binding domain-containing protein